MDQSMCPQFVGVAETSIINSVVQTNSVSGFKCDIKDSQSENGIQNSEEAVSQVDYITGHSDNPFDVNAVPTSGCTGVTTVRNFELIVDMNGRNEKGTNIAEELYPAGGDDGCSSPTTFTRSTEDGVSHIIDHLDKSQIEAKDDDLMETTSQSLETNKKESSMTNSSQMAYANNEWSVMNDSHGIYYYYAGCSGELYSVDADGYWFVQDNSGSFIPYIHYNGRNFHHRAPLFPCDAQGRYILPTNSRGIRTFPVDANRVPVFPMDSDTNALVFPVDENGQPVFPTGPVGRPVVPVDSHGLPVFPRDESGRYIFPSGPNGKPAAPVNIYGIPMMPLDDKGKPIIPYDANGMPLIHMASDGVTPLTDEEYQYSLQWTEYYNNLYKQAAAATTVNYSVPPPSYGHPPSSVSPAVGIGSIEEALKEAKRLKKVRPEDIDLPPSEPPLPPPAPALSPPVASAPAVQPPAMVSHEEVELPKPAPDAALKARTKRMIEMQLRFARKKQQQQTTTSDAATGDQSNYPTVQAGEELASSGMEMEQPPPPSGFAHDECENSFKEATSGGISVQENVQSDMSFVDIDEIEESAESTNRSEKNIEVTMELAAFEQRLTNRVAEVMLASEGEDKPKDTDEKDDLTESRIDDGSMEMSMSSEEAKPYTSPPSSQRSVLSDEKRRSLRKNNEIRDRSLSKSYGGRSREPKYRSRSRSARHHGYRQERNSSRDRKHGSSYEYKYSRRKTSPEDELPRRTRRSSSRRRSKLDRSTSGERSKRSRSRHRGNATKSRSRSRSLSRSASLRKSVERSLSHTRSPVRVGTACDDSRSRSLKSSSKVADSVEDLCTANVKSVDRRSVSATSEQSVERRLQESSPEKLRKRKKDKHKKKRSRHRKKEKRRRVESGSKFDEDGAGEEFPHFGPPPFTPRSVVDDEPRERTSKKDKARRKKERKRKRTKVDEEEGSEPSEKTIKNDIEEGKILSEKERFSRNLLPSSNPVRSAEDSIRMRIGTESTSDDFIICDHSMLLSEDQEQENAEDEKSAKQAEVVNERKEIEDTNEDEKGQQLKLIENRLWGHHETRNEEHEKQLKSKKEVSEDGSSNTSARTGLRKKSYEEVIAEVDRLRSLRKARRENAIIAAVDSSAQSEVRKQAVGKPVLETIQKVRTVQLPADKAKVGETAGNVHEGNTSKKPEKLKALKDASTCEFDEDEEDELTRLRYEALRSKTKRLMNDLRAERRRLKRERLRLTLAKRRARGRTDDTTIDQILLSDSSYSSDTSDTGKSNNSEKRRKRKLFKRKRHAEDSLRITNKVLEQKFSGHEAQVAAGEKEQELNAPGLIMELQKHMAFNKGAIELLEQLKECLPSYAPNVKIHLNPELIRKNI